MAREMEEKRINRSKAHSIFIENRERITINGVEDVESFNAEMDILVLEDGFLAVRGDDLHINKLNLDEGQLIVEGLIIAIDYTDSEGLGGQGGGLFGKLFK
mgnify:CR=1 FL=1